MPKIKQKTTRLTTFALIGIMFSYMLLYGNWFNNASAAISSGVETRASLITAASSNSPTAAAIGSNGAFIIAWASTENAANPDPTGGGIYFQLYNRFGAPQLPSSESPSDQLANTTTIGDQSDPSIAADQKGNFVITWTDNNNGNGDYDVYARAYLANGTAVGTPVKINTNSSKVNPLAKIAMDYDGPSAGNNTNFVVTWQTSTDGSNLDIAMQRMIVNFVTPSNMTSVADETVVNTYTTDSQQNPQVAMNTDSEFMVTWWGAGSEPAGDQIWYQAYSSTGVALGVNTKVNSNSVTSATLPSIATDKKTRTSADATTRSYVIAYNGLSIDDSDGIYARQITCTDPAPLNGSDADITCALNPVEINVNTTISGVQTAPEISADYLGNFTINWQDNSGEDGSSKGVFAQSYRYNDGNPYGALSRFGAEFKVNTTTTGDQYKQSIAMNSAGQYIIAFYDSSTNSIKFQKFVSDIFKLDPENLANTANSETNQYNISTAIAPNGNHAAVWVNSNPRGIYFSLWDSDNNVIVENSRIDNASGAADYPAISFYKDNSGSDIGRFIIVWNQLDRPACAATEGFGQDIYYREVDANGNLQGSCETKINPLNENDGNQTRPAVSAGYYNNDGGAAEDNFAVSYLNVPSSGNSTIESAYHNGESFNFSTVDSNCTECTLTRVALNKSNNHIVYVWDNADDGGGGAWLREAIGQNLGSAVRINPANGLKQEAPDVDFIPVSEDNEQFITVYTQYNEGLTSSQIYGKRYTYNAGGAPTVIDSDFIISTEPLGTSQQSYARIAADTTSGNFIVAWSNIMPGQSDFDIAAKLFNYTNASEGGITEFSPAFIVNSTELDNQSLPSISMNSTGTIFAGWEGNYQVNVGQVNAGDDPNGAIVQVLNSPLYQQAYPSLQPQARQAITGGGKTLSAPATIQFPNSTIDTASANSVYVSIRSNTLPEPDPIQYMDFEDLDGVSATITVSSSDFSFSDNDEKYIFASDLAIKNCDQDLASDPLCKDTINGNAEDFNLDSAPTADNDMGMDAFFSFASNVEQKTLASKTGNRVGKWRFYPKFKLRIPAIIPPGDHNATITFSVT